MSDKYRITSQKPLSSSQIKSQSYSKLENQVAKELFNNRQVEWIKNAKDSWFTIFRAACSTNLSLGDFFQILFDKNTRINISNLFANMEQEASQYAQTLAAELKDKIDSTNLVSRNKSLLNDYIQTALNNLEFDTQTKMTLENIKNIIPNINSNTGIMPQAENAEELIKKGTIK